MYAAAIKINLQKSKLDVLADAIRAIDTQIFDLQRLSLVTDINRGLVELDQAGCQAKISKIIDLEYQKELMSLELTLKTLTFEKYFNDKVADVKA